MAATLAKAQPVQVTATDRVEQTDQLDGPGSVSNSHTDPSPLHASDIDLALRLNGILTL